MVCVPACKGVGDKSTGTTIWSDLGIPLGNGDGGGPSGPDMSGPPLPWLLTPLTPAQTQTANISLYFQVTDANGNGVPGLCCDQNPKNCPQGCDFIDQEDGTAIDPKESAFTVKTLGANLTIPTVLLIDISGSVSATLPDIQKAAKSIIDNMPNVKGQKIALMTFADNPHLRVNFTTDTKALDAAVDAIMQGDDGVATNLYGAATQAVGMWQDGFASDPTMSTLTTGLLIVMTDGKDDRGVSTLANFQAAAGNKRVITIGVGDKTSIDIPALYDMASCPAYDVNTMTTPPPCPFFINETSYSALVMDIAKVTNTIETLAQSIYVANYCSPKGAGTHELLFTTKLNESYTGPGGVNVVNASCQAAIFAPSAPSTCANLGDHLHTQACQDINSNVTCCPLDAPFWCPTAPSSASCFPTAAAAQQACGSGCIECGGTGTGANDMGFATNPGTDLLPGPAIRVTFNANNYKTTQCPQFWPQVCKDAMGCCGTVSDVPPDFQQQCVNAVNSALGDSTQCMNDKTMYCISPMTNCTALQTCCNTYTPTAATTSGTKSAYNQCMDAFFQNNANETQCTTLGNEYCPSMSGNMPNCATLKSCCTSITGIWGQAVCTQQLVSFSDAGNSTPATGNTNCLNDSNYYCPSGVQCKALAACCNNFGQQYQTQCYSDLRNAAANETTCMNTYAPRYCPTTTNCTRLQTCCSAKPEVLPQGQTGTNRSQCEQALYNANNNDPQCMTALSNNGC